MKFTSSFAIATLFLGAVSAFGLQPSPSATKAVRRNGAFGGQKQAMVQPINIDGQRMNSEFVSILHYDAILSYLLGLRLFLKL
jgi:hypothetical protein